MRQVREQIEAAFARWLAQRRAGRSASLVVGLAGAQGTGKSTLAARVCALLEAQHGLRFVTFSLDDLYSTRLEREALAARVHPLLRTRGVPGTHDVDLGLRALAALRAADSGKRVRLPRFDKASDDRAPAAEWPEVEGPFDGVIFEGWCVGARPEAEPALDEPVNALEREEDADGRYRGYVNAQLAGPYQALFTALDALVFLAAPDLESSWAWRLAQEHALRAARRDVPRRPAGMSDAQLGRFVQHFQRISRHMLNEVPARADLVLWLDAEHHYVTPQ